MDKKRNFVQTWEDHVFEEGWHAWRHKDSTSNEPTGIMWIYVKSTGTEKFIVYYYEGNCISLESTEPLRYIVVCPVVVLPKNSVVMMGSTPNL